MRTNDGVAHRRLPRTLSDNMSHAALRVAFATTLTMLPHTRTSYGAVDSPHVRITLCAATPLTGVGGGSVSRDDGSRRNDGGNSGGGGGGGRGRGSGDGGGGEGMDWRNPLAGYMKLLDCYPLTTKIVTSGIIGALSDILAQRISGTSYAEISWRRVAALTIVGAILTAPLFHYLYERMEATIPTKLGWKNTALQLAIDQLLGAPVWLAAFFPLVAACELAPDANTIAKISASQYANEFVPALLLTWKIFIPTQTFSFVCLPIRTRVLALNIVDLAYTAALSYLSHENY